MHFWNEGKINNLKDRQIIDALVSSPEPKAHR